MLLDSHLLFTVVDASFARKKKKKKFRVMALSKWILFCFLLYLWNQNSSPRLLNRITNKNCHKYKVHWHIIQKNTDITMNDLRVNDTVIDKSINARQCLVNDNKLTKIWVTVLKMLNRLAKNMDAHLGAWLHGVHHTAESD